MKHIEKASEPEFLLEFKEGQSPDWRPSFAAMTDDKVVREALKSALLAEQGHLCCYCCRRIESGSSHFEHLNSRETYPELDLDYGNLLASCNSEGPNRRCGARKANRRLEVSPLDPQCEQCFSFDLDGGISSRLPESPAIDRAIELLGLDLPLLRESRLQAIRGFTDGIDQLSDQEILSLLHHVRLRNGDGRFVAYQPAVVQALAMFVRVSSLAP